MNVVGDLISLLPASFESGTVICVHNRFARLKTRAVVRVYDRLTSLESGTAMCVDDGLGSRSEVMDLKTGTVVGVSDGFASLIGW